MGYFFHLYKEHSIKFFFIWTGGVEQVFLPLPFLYKVSSWLLVHSSLLPSIAFSLPLIVNSVCTPCLLTDWRKFPMMLLEMNITDKPHNGIAGWCIGDTSRSFWSLHFMGHLFSCFWNALMLSGLRLTPSGHTQIQSQDAIPPHLDHRERYFLA